MAKDKNIFLFAFYHIEFYLNLINSKLPLNFTITMNSI